MTDTIREKIIVAFTHRAQALAGTLPVLRAKRSIDESDERFISVWDGEESSIKIAYGSQSMQFPIAVECITKTVEHSSECNAIMGEIIACMIGTDSRFNGLALKTELAAAAPIYPDDGSLYSNITVFFNITYEMALGDPYNQPT
jgi:hypothetical protein